MATYPGGPRLARRAAPVAVLAGVLLLTVLVAAGCSGNANDQPVRDSREALGTFVTVTLYGPDAASSRHAIDRAYEAINAAERTLSAYPDASSQSTPAPPGSLEVTSVSAFNLAPYEWHLLPSRATRVLDRVKALDVERYFSPGMLRVVQLYHFESGGTVPDPSDLARMTRAAQAFESTVTSAGTQARFRELDASLAPPRDPSSSFAPPAVGLDLSGAAKGLALDEGLDALLSASATDALDGALVSAGSTTLIYGRKPGTGDGAVWHVGIEDPRDPSEVIGVVDFALPGPGTGGNRALGTVSTSGDYQQAFVSDGVRYHHILAPDTGEPARGMRSLTVVGASTGLDSDILSTALFVMGIPEAERYARNHGLALFIVDNHGRTRIVPGPEGSSWTIRATKQ